MSENSEKSARIKVPKFKGKGLIFYKIHKIKKNHRVGQKKDIFVIIKKNKIENVFMKTLTITIHRTRVPKRGERNILPTLRE